MVCLSAKASQSFSLPKRLSTDIKRTLGWRVKKSVHGLGQELLVGPCVVFRTECFSIWRLMGQQLGSALWYFCREVSDCHFRGLWACEVGAQRLAGCRL